MELWDTSQTRSKLERLISAGSNGTILSAFFSKPAYNWLKSLSPDAKHTLVSRGRPSDFLANAISFEALEEAIKNDWKVFLHHDLHAKIFLFEESIILGSSNLTSNGFNLLSNGGNIELNVEVPLTIHNQKIISNIVNIASRLNLKILQDMKDFISDIESPQGAIVNKWPSEIIETLVFLYFSDFPTNSFKEELHFGENEWGEIAREWNLNRSEKALNQLFETKPYQYLNDILTANPTGLSFGKISSLLHNILKNDPSPKRREVKDLLQYFTSFLEEMDTPIRITRPNYSQIFKLNQ